MIYLNYLAHVGNTMFYDKFNGDFSSKLLVKCIKDGCFTNILFAIRTIQEYPEVREICHIAVTKFLLCGYINDYLVDKYIPFFFWYKQQFCDYNVYKELMIKHPKLNYSIAKALITQRYNDLYFSYNFEPDVELLIIAAISDNKEIYEDQLTKAKKLGYCYSYLDHDNKIVREVPLIEEIPNLELKLEPSSLFTNIIDNVENAEYALVNNVEEFKYLQMIYDMNNSKI